MPLPSRQESSRGLLRPFLLVLITCAAWIGYLELGPINDDYQIIGHHKLAKVSNPDPFAPFYQPDISQVYYRPLPNALHRFLVDQNSFSVLQFRISALALYCLLVLSFYLCVRAFTSSPRTAFWAALIFSLLPTHWYFLGWIAGLGDLLICLFALWGLTALQKLFLTRQRRFAILYILSMALSVLSKEHGYMLAAAPLLFFILQRPRQKLYIHLFLISILLIALHLLVAGAVNPSSLAQSSNLDDPSLSRYLFTPFAFLITSFLDPHSFDIHHSTLPTLLFLFVSFVVMLVLIRPLYSNYRKTFSTPLPRLFFWLTLAFLLPAMPLFMPWYAIYISIPHFLMLTLALQNLLPHLSTGRKRILAVLVLVLISINIFLNVNRSVKSVEASKYIHKVFSNSPELLSEKADSIIMLGYEPRYNGINTFLIGKQQFTHVQMGLPPGEKPDIDVQWTRGEHYWYLGEENGYDLYYEYHPIYEGDLIQDTCGYFRMYKDRSKVVYVYSTQPIPRYIKHTNVLESDTIFVPID